MSSRPFRSIQSAHLRLDFLSTGGPRLIGLYLTDYQANLLAETPDVSWNTPYGIYHLIGGHRLWIAPESHAYTSVPDDHGLGVTEFEDWPELHIRLTQSPDSATQISRSIEIQLAHDYPAITLTHRLTNAGSQPFTCAAWAITQLPLGGTALLPFLTGSVDQDGLQPNRNLILWPYTQLGDPRFHFHRMGCLLQGLSMPTACKIGSFNFLGWLGYFWKDIFFCKRFNILYDSVYTDHHCNAELFVHDRFLELETLSPLTTLLPGATLSHIEYWQVHRLPHPLDPSMSPESLFDLAKSLLSTAPH